MITIWNLALSNIGTSKLVSAIGERSKEADACRRHYDRARDATLRDYNWPFAREDEHRLALVEDLRESKDSRWAFAYRYPADCIRMINVLCPGYSEPRRWKFRRDDSTGLILTDVEDAEAEYTARVTDPVFWKEDFETAVGYRLAVLIAPTIGKGDQNRVGEKNMALYMQAVSKAETNAANEGETGRRPEVSELERSRI